MSQIQYAIKSVKETEFFTDESLELEAQVDLNYNASIQTKLETEEVLVTIMVSYSSKTTRHDFLRSKVVSSFIIKDMKNYVPAGSSSAGIDLPDPLWVAMFGISFSHARALLAKSAAATKYAHMTLPLIDPEKEFRKLFAKELEKNAIKK